MGARLRTLDELSRPKSEACLDNSERCANVDYDYWIAWLFHVEALVRCKSADDKRGSDGE